MSACGCDQNGLRPVDQAIAELLKHLPQSPAVEKRALTEALGLTLAEDICAPRPMPAWDNSAMDGYALRAADLPTAGGVLPLAGRITAGDAAQAELPAGHAVRIFTGAPLPPGADAVIAQENTRLEGGGVWLPACTPGTNVRRRGEEFAEGDLLLPAGRPVRAAELALIASLGLAKVKVYRPLRVGLLSSGNELREPGEPLAPGQIYNANRYGVLAALRGWGLEVVDGGVLIDELPATREALREAAGRFDVLISSGGVSVGEEDHLKQAVRELGELNLWRLAIQPGKPFAFGRVCGTPWIGLPGNPVAALLTLLVVARPYLLAAQGRSQTQVQAIPVPSAFAWRKANGRRQYLRVQLRADEHGLRLHSLSQQGSAMLSGLSAADGLAVIEVNRTLEEGESVGFLSLAQLLS